MHDKPNSCKQDVETLPMLPSAGVCRSSHRNGRGTVEHDFWRSTHTLEAVLTEERKRKTSRTDAPDGLVHEEPTASDEAAITLILNYDQAWRRTHTNNPGFDLFEVAEGQMCSQCEVKAMKDGLQDRSVGLSLTQFERTRVHGTDYWLRVVERAGQEDARIVRIQDPAGKAKAFTLDKGPA